LLPTLRWIPGTLLAALAVAQIVLAQTAALSPWSGGGFGMFSTTDAGGARHLHAYVLRPGLRRELEPPVELEQEVQRALTLPSDARLAALAQKLATQSTPDDGPATGLELQVWRQAFDPHTLAPSGQLVRRFELELEPD
jgi:hypothetical protein